MNSDVGMDKDEISEMLLQPDLKEKKSFDDIIGIIDFRNVKSPINQAKVEIMVLERSFAGFSLLQFDTSKRISNLKRKKSNSSDSEIVELEKQLSVYQDEHTKKRYRKSDVIKKFWIKQWERRYFAFSREFYENQEFQKKKLEELDKFLSLNNVDEGLEADKRKAYEYILERNRKRPPRGLVEPKEYSPPNDPDDEFGWKTFYNRKIQLQRERRKEKERYFSCKKNKSLETPMDKIHVKKNSCSSPEDSGIELNAREIYSSYETIINREWLEFLFSKSNDFMSEELRESFKGDIGLEYLMERPTPGFGLGNNQ